MNGPSEVRYEVHVSDGGRWTVYTDAPTKGRAIQRGAELLGSGKFDAVKVTEDRGQRQEILVWSEEAKRVEKAETITPVEDAPVCEKLDDFYAFEARLTLGRLLRQFMDKRALTPLEFLHDYTHIREFTRNDDMNLQAIQCIAAILSRKTKKKPIEMMDFLEDMVRQMTGRAESLGDLDRYLPSLDGGIGAMSAEIAKAKGEFERDFFVRAVLARRLRKWRDWDGKLVGMLDLADKSIGQDNFALIDEAVAEILDGSEGIQEVLGYRRNLAAALEVMVQIATGEHKPEGAPTTLSRLSAMIEGGHFLRARTALTDRIVRALSSLTPLTKGERDEQQDAFRSLAQQMIGTTMFANSGPLCVAATLRAKSVMKREFEDESTERAVDEMILLLPTFATKLGYLLDLVGTDFGARCQAHIIQCLATLLGSITSVSQIVEKGASDEYIVRAAAGIRDRLLAANVPQEWRQRFAKRIYDLLITHANPDAAPPPVAAKPAPTPAAAAAPPPAKSTAEETRRSFASGDIIFSEGEAGDVAYLIVSGAVEILKRAGERDIVIGEVGPGSIIGEMALIDSQPRMATARTMTETVVNMIPREAIKARLDKLEKFDPVLRRLMGMFVDRMRDFRYMSSDS